MTNIIINKGLPLAPVSPFSPASTEPSRQNIKEQPVKSEGDKEGGNPQVRGLLIDIGLQFVHVPNGEAEADPNGKEDEEVEDENVELSLVVILLVVSFLITVLFKVVLSQPVAEEEVDNPTNTHTSESEGDDIFSSSLIASDSVEERVPKGTVDASNEDQGSSGFLGEDIVSDLPDGVEGVMSPAIFPVVNAVDGSVVHWQGENEEEKEDTDSEPETVVGIHSNFEVSSVAQAGGGLVSTSSTVKSSIIGWGRSSGKRIT